MSSLVNFRLAYAHTRSMGLYCEEYGALKINSMLYYAAASFTIGL